MMGRDPVRVKPEFLVVAVGHHGLGPVGEPIVVRQGGVARLNAGVPGSCRERRGPTPNRTATGPWIVFNSAPRTESISPRSLRGTSCGPASGGVAGARHHQW